MEVSTFVGGMDLPLRTQWELRFKVEKGRSNFETKAMWYNPTPMVQPYYNWMTAGAFAQDDLELVFPGNQYLKHSGGLNPGQLMIKEEIYRYMITIVLKDINHIMLLVNGKTFLGLLS
ncbi:MAG: hypothetical protein Ct9H300mP18_09400 [Candidatus Neomarinimicrobiota bacterium]|nr:MAG: hypothetical protein Ct9H300mP18_09400 [Candidatus Neomarinimicrobiota bacterium]